MKLSTFSVISRVQIQLKLRSSLFAERFYFAHGLPFDLQELVEEEPADFMKGDCIKKKNAKFTANSEAPQCTIT